MTGNGPKNDSPATIASPHSLRRGWMASVLIVIALALLAETLRWSNAEERMFALTRILSGRTPDWFPFLPLLAAGAFAIVRLRPDEPAAPLRRESETAHSVTEPAVPASATTGTDRASLLIALVIGLFAFGVSRSVGGAFLDGQGRTLPPAYHDEYSYLFQAETFLHGRTSFPSFQPRPELFDQMHVLNEGRFASRYFPGTGLWLAPFVAWGDPWLGQQVSHGIAAALSALIGCGLGRRTGGVVAGLLFGISPGLVLFSNLLLAHHPTLVGLLLFLWALLNLRRTAGIHWALLTGIGLAFAMLCRPMTAAGFALPAGVWFAWYLLTGRGFLDPEIFGAHSRTWTVRRKLAAALGGPLVLGLIALAWYSWKITGDPWLTPYHLYTDVYTPRHRYGFNNVLIGEQHLGPKVLDHYDRWAENLTPRLALENLWRRSLSSLRLTLGLVPLLLGGIAVLWSGLRRWPGWFLFASIASLHVVHVPYWFSGIMDWHYVLESAPLWLLLAGLSTSELTGCARRANCLAPRLWWSAVLSLAVLINTVSVPISTTPAGEWWLWIAPLQTRMSEVRFPRVRYAAVRDEVDRLRQNRRAIVFVIPDPADRSMDWVTNNPTLTADVLWARVPPREASPEDLYQLAALFPDRVAMVLHASGPRLSPLMPPDIESPSPPINRRVPRKNG